jgi:TatD DNase family protein
LPYIDIHTHTYYQDPETVLVLNVFPEEQDKLELPSFFSVGLHPWHVQVDTWETRVGMVQHAVELNRVLAVGEAGLDKVVGNSYNLQQQAFAAQVVIAEKQKKPLIIHCVRSYSEILAHRKKSDQSVPWIFHWFNADEQVAKELIRKNCYLSFGHMLFREQSKACRVFNTIPTDRIFLETDDAGYGIREIYARAAGLGNITVTDLMSRILDNFSRCFQV